VIVPRRLATFHSMSLGGFKSEVQHLVQ
jgi:hypothetical protein